MLVVLLLYLFFNFTPSLRCGVRQNFMQYSRWGHSKFYLNSFKITPLVSFSVPDDGQHLIVFLGFFCLLLLTDREVSELSAVIQELLLSYSLQFWAQQPLTPVLIDCFSLKVKLLCHLFAHSLSFKSFGIHQCQDSISLSQKAYHHLQLWKQLVLLAQIRKKTAAWVWLLVGSVEKGLATSEVITWAASYKTLRIYVS